MTIRTQNLLVIPPIFLILGLTVGFLADRAAREEILWGLEEEAVALAVTVAEMVGGTTLDRLAEGSETAVERVDGGLSRMSRHGQIESVVLYSHLRDGPVLAWHRDTTAAAMEEAFWDEPVRGVREHAVLGSVGPWGPYAEALVAAAPIYAAGGGADLRGAATVVIDATRLSTLTGRLRRNFILLVGLITGLGVAAALFLSARIGHQVTELRRVGATVAAGEYRAPVQVSGVKEVQDLSNTLGTMASILADVFSRGRRALLVGDPFLLAQGVASAYRDERQSDVGPPEGFDVGFSAIGDPAPGSLHGWADAGRWVVFWAGRVGEGEALDRSIQAAAVNRALQHGLQRGPPDAVTAEIMDLFRFGSLQAAWFCRDGSEPDEVRCLAGNGQPLRQDDTLVLHSFPAGRMDALTGSLSLFRDLPAARAARELPLALPQDSSGVVLLIRRVRHTPSGGPS